MCGVAGVYGYHSAAGPIDQHALESLRDAMARRGPDGFGTWVDPTRRVGLAHRRLAIIDPTGAGAQPMRLHERCRPGSDLVITFNGEIYNYRELRRDLERRGHSFTSNSDTEVMLHLYEEEGRSFVQRLRGMFAFALWDGQSRELLLGRDPYGVKPLYYADDGEQVWIASEARPLAKAVAGSPSDAALAGFLILGSVPEPLTAWDDIAAVPAGSTILISPSGMGSPHRFFSLAGALREAGLADVVTEPDRVLRAALLDTVGAHLVSDVEVGLFLSAGIDSGAVLGAASELATPFTAVTMGFTELGDTAADEVPLAREVAALYGARHVVVSIDPDDLSSLSGEVLGAMDQPSIDGLNTWLVSRAAAHAGLKVALSGLGGDELLGGYSTFASIPAWRRRLGLPAAVPGLGRAVRIAMSISGSMRRPKLAGAVQLGKSLQSVWLLHRALFLPSELGSLLGQDRARAALESLNLPRRLDEGLNPDPESGLLRVAALEAGLYMKNQLLRDADWASMAHSLEVRVPLVDPDLLRAVSPVTAQRWQRDHPKRLLAEAPCPPLPAHVAARAKTGFAVPIGDRVLEARDAPWRRVPALRDARTPWQRRWAYTVAEEFGFFEHRSSKPDP
jgi:asparagine synthase (glutamine-hydrolysing)